MPTSTITGKERTTLPKEVRDALDLEPGNKLSGYQEPDCD